MSSLRPIADSVAILTKGTFARKFVSLGRILTSWPDIIGPELAARAQPLKLHYRKPKDAKEKPNVALDIAVSSADATLLQYQKDLILERINQLFGDSWVTSLRFVHVAANEKTEPRAPASPLSVAEQNDLEDSLAYVDDPEIRKRLEQLGQGVLRQRGKAPLKP